MPTIFLLIAQYVCLSFDVRKYINICDGLRLLPPNVDYDIVDSGDWKFIGIEKVFFCSPWCLLDVGKWV